MNWSTAAKTWTLDVAVDGGKTRRTLNSHFLLLGTGYFDHGVPLNSHIPGIGSFRGPVVHPQFWPSEDEVDFRDKNVVVIGSGATAITPLPSLGKIAAHVTMLQRSPTYIMSIPREDRLEKLIRLLLPAKLIRVKWVAFPLLLVTFCRRYSRLASWLLLRLTKAQLPAHTSLSPDFTPSYNPWEQRMCMCPDADFFKCLRDGKGSVVTDVIETVTENSIRLKSGTELQPDVIITATGLKLRLAGSIIITVDNVPFSISDRFAWKCAMIEGLPNTLLALGYVDAS